MSPSNGLWLLRAEITRFGKQYEYLHRFLESRLGAFQDVFLNVDYVVK